MAHEFKMLRRVEFVDTDMAGIVHFSNFFRFMEAAEHAFFASLGLTLHGEKDGRMFGWARVHASCDYLKPARYMDVLEVHVVVQKKTSSTLSYRCVFNKTNAAGGGDAPEDAGEIARGELKVAYVSTRGSDGRMRAFPMPEEVARTIEVAPEVS